MLDLNDVYQELKSWQTGIGALLGFIALGAGALINYHLARRRDKHVRNEEVISIALALYGEIVLLRMSMARLANYVAAKYMRSGYAQREGDFDQYFREMVEFPQPTMFPALASRLGMLPPAIALEIGKFYARVEEVRAWLPRMQEDPDRKYSYSILHLLDPALDAVRFVVPTLEEIEKLAGIDAASLGLDIRDAITASDIEHELQAAHN
jgi:hypothetical protein